MVVLYAGAKNYLNQKDVWGRPGPGGRAWRDPKKIGSNFFKSMGWTNNSILNKLSKDTQTAREREQIYEITGGGVELVPLLAKHRMVTRCPLPTTDITRMSRICNDLPKTGFTGQEYFRELCHQVHEREKQKQVILLLAFIPFLQVFAKQASNTRGAVSRQNLSEKNVRLDPLLRRALLRALTELEKEAQEKVRAEEIRYARSEPKVINENSQKSQDEIQSTADSNYPSPSPVGEELPTHRFDETADSSTPATQQDTFVYQTPTSVEETENTSVQESKSINPTINPSEIASNLIADVAFKEKSSAERTDKTENASQEKKEENDPKVETKKPGSSDNEVDIFKAPLVAAFTLHQDSKGTPHSVIPLFRKEPQDNQRQQLLQQQFQLYQQQQQQQFLQNQFIPSVTITPLSQSNQFNQPSRFFSSGTLAPSFSSSTVFPPLVSNSILPQSFSSSVFPPHSFQPSTTLAPFRTNHQSFLTTVPPQRNLSPQPFPSTLLPSQDFSVVQSHNFNFSPTPQPSFATPTIAPPQGLQPISIPPVTLPLQNEPRFQAPIIVPSLQINQDQTFLNQEQQRLRNQFLIEEQNRQRLIEEQNRQRQIEEDNKQRQIEEQNRQRQIEEQNRQRQIEEQNRQRQIEEQNRQRQIEEQNRQRQIEEQNRQIEEQRQRQRQQIEELNRQRQIEEERARLLLEQNLRQESQLRQQRQEQGVDFQRSLGFSFNQNVQSLSKPQNNGFSFHIQPSHSFVPPLNFGEIETRNRVNRQEGFGSTGNLGLVNNQGHRNPGTAQNHFQSNQVFSNIQNSQEYRTIPEEHYRNPPVNQFHQANRFQHFRHHPNNFQQNNVQEVNKQLQKLLLQSGVASDVSGQEDLNIVSKVLALNHERSDTNVDDTILRNERRVEDPSEKSLGVGEIKDIELTKTH